MTTIMLSLGLEWHCYNDALTWARILMVGRIFIHQGISPTCILAKDDDWVKLKEMSKQINKHLYRIIVTRGRHTKTDERHC